MRPWPTVLVLLACVVPGRALAGSYEYELQGTGTVARSGANVAHVEDPSALYLNVAGIGKLDQVQILLDTNITNIDTGVKLSGNRVDGWSVAGVEYDYMYVENDDRPFLGPMIAGSFGVPGVEGLVVGLGVFGPAAVGDYTFRLEREVGDGALVPGPQRYDLIQERVLFFWPTVALAYRITDRLVVGMGFQWGYLDFEYAIAGNLSPVRTPTTYLSDFISEVHAVDAFVPAYLVGLAWRPLDWLETGLSLRVSDGIDARSRSVVVTMNPWGDDPIRSDDPTIEWMDTNPNFDRPHGRVWFDWPPLKLRAGVRFALPRAGLAAAGPGSTVPVHLRERFDVELAFFYEPSFERDGTVVGDMFMQVDGQVPIGRDEGQATVLNPARDGVFSIERHWKQNWSLRLGGDVNLLKGRITLSAGGFYDRGAAPGAYSRLDYMAFDRWGLSTGFVFRVWKLDLKVAYVHMFYPDRKVTGGKVQHLLGTGDPDNAAVVNNGTYEAAIDVVAVGVTVRI
jgi:long-subunit fatty acid transport protein